MISIMTDFHLAESWVIENKKDSLPPEKQLRQHYATIFGKHNIAEQQYKASYNYYVRNPVLMQHNWKT